MTYHVQILLLVRQPLFDRAALLLTQTSWVLPPLSVGKMTLRLYGALNYSHGLSKGPSFATGRGLGSNGGLETCDERDRDDGADEGKAVGGDRRDRGAQAHVEAQVAEVMSTVPQG